MKVTVAFWMLRETVPLLAPLTLVTVNGSPFGSVSLASRAEVAMVVAVSFVTAMPVSLTAVGAWFVVVPPELNRTSTQKLVLLKVWVGNWLVLL